MATGMLLRGLVADGAVRLLVAEGAELARHTTEVHDLNGDAGELAASGMLASILLSAHLKGEEQLTTQLQSESPRFAMYVDLLGPERADAPEEVWVRVRFTPSGVPSTGPLAGLFQLQKSLGSKQLYAGVSELQGSIESSLHAHLNQSAQVDAVVRIFVVRDGDGNVATAQGLLLERLPVDKTQASMTTAGFSEAYDAVREAPPADLFTSLAFGKLFGEEINWLEKVPVKWQCRCSEERVERMLVSLGAAELNQMADEDHGAEITCHFCSSVRSVTEARLRELADS